MGIFSEKCTKCGSRVKKGAESCSECSEPRRGAWRLCFSCGSSVGAQSKFCWKCSADLRAQPCDQLFDDRWRRSETDFAVKFPLRVSRGIVKHGIQIDEGTRAYLYVNGKSGGFLKPGYHVKSSLFERLTKLERLSENSFAILVSTGPAMVTFPIGGLRDSEQVPLGALVKLELELSDPAKFYEQAMVSRETFGNMDIVNLVGEEVKDAVQKRAATYTIEDLLVDYSQREGLEEVLREEIPKKLETYGLRMESVRLARFTGESVEEIRKLLGDKAVKARRDQVLRELRKLERENQLEGAKIDLEFDQAEKRLRETMELDNLESDWLKSEWLATKAHLSEMRNIEQGNEQEAKRLEGEIARVKVQIEKERLIAEGQAEIDDIEREGDEKDLQLAETAAAMGLRIRANRDLLRHEEELRQLELKLKESREKADIEAGTIKVLSEANASQGTPEMANALLRLLQAQKGQKITFEPGPYNQEFKGVQPGVSPFGNASMAGVAVPSSIPDLGNLKFPASVMWDTDKRLSNVARAKESTIGLITLLDATGKARPIGTGWHMGNKMLATCAHVAEEVVRGVESGEVCWVSFPHRDHTLKAKVSRSVMHPSYESSAISAGEDKPAVPIFDVAILMVEEAPSDFLAIAVRPKLDSLLENSHGSKVAYMGFPSEEMAGGGVNILRPVPTFKSGTISQITDWALGRAEFEEALLISHDLGLAGGVSGSPLFDEDGDVVGIVCAGNMTVSMHPDYGTKMRSPSAAMVNFAQRVDLLGQLIV